MPSGRVIARGELEGLTPTLASLYAKAGPRTLSRDLNRLEEAGLIVKRKRGWRSNVEIIKAFMPPMADAETNGA
jgi:DNA-binding transcriptional ArsR family regulator